MKRKAGERLYTRIQGKTGVARYYADLRDLGHGQIALRAPGASRATSDGDEALILLGDVLKQIKDGERVPKAAARKRSVGDGSLLNAAVKRLLDDNPGEVTEKWLADVGRCLDRAIDRFGAERSLTHIKPTDIRAWINQLQKAGLAGGTIRHHLHALSSVYRYAQEREDVPLGFNPLSGLYRKPKAGADGQTSKRAKYLEIPEAAKMLEAAQSLNRIRRNGLIEFVRPLIGAFLLTGGRKAEVLGLERRDVDLDGGKVHFRPNQWRGLKRSWSEREVPLWGQLREIIGPYLEIWDEQGREPGSLVFPSPRTGNWGKESMIHDVRSILTSLGRRRASISRRASQSSATRTRPRACRRRTTASRSRFGPWQRS